MRTYLRLKNRQSHKLPAEFQDQDLRYPEELVATFLRQFTGPGDVVLDPFAGYGTTLIVAEAMDRVPYGVEPTPAEMAPDVTTGFYYPAAADGSRPGGVMVVSAKNRIRW